MKELGPAEFSAATGLSVKALRLYDERGLLVPARVDQATGYRRYADDQIVTAGRIALLRRAGIGLADIERFLAGPAAAVIDRWLADLAAETEVRRRALDALASALGFGISPAQEPAMAVIIRPIESAAELATAFDVAGAQFDPAIEHTDQRRFAELEAAYPAQRELLLVAEESGSVVGAAMGFASPGREVTLRILAVAAGRAGRASGAPCCGLSKPAPGVWAQHASPWATTPKPASTSGTATRPCCSCSGSMTQAASRPRWRP